LRRRDEAGNNKTHPIWYKLVIDLFVLGFFTMNILLSLLIAFLYLKVPKLANAVCSIEQPSRREQFQLSPVVARLNYTGETVTLPCGIEVLVESDFSYVIEDTFGSFQVLEVFKGDLDEVSIPLFLATDLGYFGAIDSRFEQDTEGFLAYLMPYRRCHTENSPETFPYPDDFEPTPYSMSTCATANTPWSQVPEDDIIFLRNGGVAADGPSISAIPSVMPSYIPTVPPVTITKAPATPSPTGGTDAPKGQTSAPATGSPVTDSPVTASPVTDSPVTASPVVLADAETPSPVVVTKEPTTPTTFAPIPPLTPFPTQESASGSQSLGNSGGIRSACSLMVTLLLAVATSILLLVVDA
jgi:hypothetical protein